LHNSVKLELASYVCALPRSVANYWVADLGAYNVNGSVRDLIPHAVGFDLIPGPCVNVIIHAGHIPVEHRGKYAIVASLSTFQFSDKDAFKREAVDLLAPHGELFLTMCGPNCKKLHSVPVTGGGTVEVRSFHMEVDQLAAFFEPELERIACYETPEADGHAGDLIYVGRKR